MKHRVAVTVSEPDHPAVTQRKEQVQKFVRVTADSKDDAVEKAKKHYRKSGYKVHDAEYHSEIKEEVEHIEEISQELAVRYANAKYAKDKTPASEIALNRILQNRRKNLKGYPEYEPKDMTKEEIELEEGKMDKDHPIVKEYNALKKQDIKTLRNLIKQQHRIVDTSGYTSKDHAISAYLRTKHGDKKVDAAFGFNEEVEQMNERESDPIPSVYSQGPHTKGTYHIDYVGKDKNGNVQKKTYKLKANDNHHAQSKAMKIARSEFDHVQSSANTSKFFKEEQLSFSDFIEEQSSCSKTAMIKKAVKKMKEEMNAELEENDQLQEEIEQLEEATIAYHVKKAEEAKGRGDDKKFAYHMENARTARFAMTGKEMMRNRHHLDKYNELRNAK